ncbi:hypothetical protein [Mangrovibacterium marinum]|uniref:hypothetical protein n=1 Tax=Mangrovibacterium marinum TaxID=1639118 RepID=UPI002A18C296|nr:hypothetical protein [Mangrovibacterium marinum]
MKNQILFDRVNHFHLLVRIKDDIVYRYSNADRSVDAVRFEERKWETIDLSACEAADSVRIPKPHLHFSHLFSAYSKYMNKRYDRTGSLFERPFKRKKIDNPGYLRNVVIYIHQNPVHHGFCEHPLEYPWSSYLTCTSKRSTKLKRAIVLDWFEHTGGFVQEHQERINHTKMNEWLNVEPDYYTPKVTGEVN